MRKGTKTIRKVVTRGSEYYVYDLDVDIFGKRKRLYAKSEEELKLMIKEADSERNAMLMEQKPDTTDLKEYVLFYIKNAVGSVSSVEIKHWITLFENVVFSSSLNHGIDEISAEEVQDFYEMIKAKYPIECLQEIDNVLRKTFVLAESVGIKVFDYSAIPVPEKPVKGRGKQKDLTEYIAEETELDTMLNFCLEDNCRKYKINELILTFALFTGLHINEIVELKGGDFDLKAKTVTVKDRTIDLDERIVNWLKYMSNDGKLDFKNKKELVFQTSMPTIPLTINAIAKRCGLPKGITKKSLHKAYIIRQLEKGVSPTELQKRFGYKSVNAVLKIKDDYEVKKALF